MSSKSSLNESSLSEKHAWKSVILQGKLDVIKFYVEGQTGTMICSTSVQEIFSVSLK